MVFIHKLGLILAASLISLSFTADAAACKYNNGLACPEQTPCCSPVRISSLLITPIQLNSISTQSSLNDNCTQLTTCPVSSSGQQSTTPALPATTPSLPSVSSSPPLPSTQPVLDISLLPPRPTYLLSLCSIPASLTTALSEY